MINVLIFKEAQKSITIQHIRVWTESICNFIKMNKTKKRFQVITLLQEEVI